MSDDRERPLDWMDKLRCTICDIVVWHPDYQGEMEACPHLLGLDAEWDQGDHGDRLCLQERDGNFAIHPMPRGTVSHADTWEVAYVISDWSARWRVLCREDAFERIEYVVPPAPPLGPAEKAAHQAFIAAFDRFEAQLDEAGVDPLWESNAYLNLQDLLFGERCGDGSQHGHPRTGFVVVPDDALQLALAVTVAHDSARHSSPIWVLASDQDFVESVSAELVAAGIEVGSDPFGGAPVVVTTYADCVSLPRGSRAVERDILGCGIAAAVGRDEAWAILRASGSATRLGISEVSSRDLPTAPLLVFGDPGTLDGAVCDPLQPD